jgi:hypothetical protein
MADTLSFHLVYPREMSLSRNCGFFFFPFVIYYVAIYFIFSIFDSALAAEKREEDENHEISVLRLIL